MNGRPLDEYYRMSADRRLAVVASGRTKEEIAAEG
jgi:hypothetical protein